MKTRFLWAAGAASILTTSAVFGAPPIVASALTLKPALNIKTGFLRKDGEQLVFPFVCDQPGSKSCSEVLRPLIDLVTAQVHAHLDAAYDGKPISLLPAEIAGPAKILTPICNLNRGEETKNKRKAGAQSCGELCHFTCSTDAVTHRLHCKTDEKSCTAERAYTRGALMQMARVKLAEWVAEVKKNKSFVVSPSCAVPVADADSTAIKIENQRITAAWTTVTRKPAKCAGTIDGRIPDSGSVNVSEDGPQQTPCFIEQAAHSLDKVVAPIAVCQIFRASDNAWIAAKPKLFDDNAKLATTSAHAKCQDKTGQTELENCLNEHYPVALRQLYREEGEAFAAANKNEE